MKLSMQNLADWLLNHHYNIHCDIHTTIPNLENVHWLSEEGTIRQEIVYVEPYTEFSGRQSYTTIVNASNDIIRISGQEPGVIFNLLLSVFTWFNQWERRLLACILHKKPFQEMCDIGDEVFQAPTIICGTGGQTYAITSGYSPDISPVWRARLENDAISFDTIQRHYNQTYFRKLRRAGAYPTLNDSPIWNGRTLNSNLYYRGQRKGFIVAYQYKRVFRPGDTHYMNIFSRLVEQYLATDPGRYFSLSYLEHFLYDVIMGKPADFRKLDIIFRYNGWKPTDCFYILCVIPQGKHSAGDVMLEKLQSFVSNRGNHLCSLVAKDMLVILVNQTLYDDEKNLVPDLLKKASIPVRVCQSLHFYDIRQFHDYFRQTAGAAASAVWQDQPEQQLVFVANLIAPWIKETLIQNPFALSYLHPSIEKLGRYDKEHSTCLVHTLKVWLLCGCNSTDTAQNLNIHRNTLLHRLNKIKTITNIDISASSSVISFCFSALLRDT